MNIINILACSLNEDNLHKVIAHHHVPDTEHTIQFVDTYEKRLVCLCLFEMTNYDEYFL